MADYLSRVDFIVLDELGYLPFAQSGGQLLFHLISRGSRSCRVTAAAGTAKRRHERYPRPSRWLIVGI